MAIKYGVKHNGARVIRIRKMIAGSLIEHQRIASLLGMSKYAFSHAISGRSPVSRTLEERIRGVIEKAQRESL